MNTQTIVLRRYLECTAFVLLWMACEYYLRLSPIAGQLVGIPLVAGFQLLIARRPLVQLWARDATSFRIDRQTLSIAGCLALACGVLLLLGSGEPSPGLNPRLPLFLLVLAGALPAAIALREQRFSALRRALPTILAAAAFRVVWHAMWHAHDGVMIFRATRLLDFFTLWLVEFVALFLVDEVIFRGALDPHLVRASAGRLHEWCSAVFLSILWAIWHLPAYNPGAETFLTLFAHIGPFSIGIVMLGIALSFAARQSRTLVPTSAMHALGNAYVLALTK